MTFVRMGLLLALVAGIGCGEPASGPTAADFGDKRKALKARIAEKKGKKANAKVVARNATKEKSGSAAGGFARVSPDYVYDSTGKRKTSSTPGERN